MNLFWMRTLKANESADWYSKGYPIEQWNLQDVIYRDADYAFDGDWLHEAVSSTNTELKYPLQFNPYRVPVGLHVSFLYGEVPDGADARVTFEVEVWENGIKKTTGEATSAAAKMTTFLNSVWHQNHSFSLQSQLALNAQIYGGAVLSAYYDPERAIGGDYPISLSAVDVPSFLPVWSSRSVDELIEVIIAYGVTKLQAEDLGVTPEMDVALYMENWRKDKYEITIDDKVVKMYGEPCEGIPIGNMIPYVYIPHPPRRGFYGTSLLHDMLGMGREINKQMADVGDMITDDATNLNAMRNVRNVEVKRISGVKSMLDIGSQQGDRIPDVLWAPTKSSSTTSASANVDKLIKDLRMEMYCPDVIFGGGDSSQRSTSSFAFMAIPLIAHIRDERAAFTSSLGEINHKILKIAAAKSIGKIDASMANNARVKCNWYPMLPRDVMEEITSIIARVQSKILSRETAITMIGDILDVTGELDKIKKTESELEARNNPSLGATSGQLAGIAAAKTAEPNTEGENTNDGSN